MHRVKHQRKHEGKYVKQHAVLYGLDDRNILSMS